jgi:hypothetical protein
MYACRNMPYLVSHVKAQLDESAGSALKESVQSVNRAEPIARAAKAQSITDTKIIPAIVLAAKMQCTHVHDVLCVALAEFIDKSPIGVVQSALALGASGGSYTSSSALERLSLPSLLAVLASVNELTKATMVCTMAAHLASSSQPCLVLPGLPA